MNRKRPWLPGAVMGWTIFSTVFLWTPTMRGFFRPDISFFAVMDLRGSGREGWFWIFPALAVLALLLFYLEGRNRLRPLFHALLLGWHLPVTAIVLYGALSAGDDAYFEGAMWGVRLPLWLVAIPFMAFSALAVGWVVLEMRGAKRADSPGWSHVHWQKLGVAGLLLLPAALLFYFGQGFDWKTMLATAVTVAQWIFLATGLSHR